MLEVKSTTQSVNDVYDRLFKSGSSLSKIRDAALESKLFSPAPDGPGVPGRSLAWKLFLSQHEPLLQASEWSLSPDLSSLRRSRKRFSDLLLDKMRAPDGSYEEGLVVPGMDTPPRREALTYDLEMNNPLSLHDENPWTEWFASVELRKTILQDVERTFPEIPYFRKPHVQLQLSNVLFLYSVTNKAVGYRQGMHEILAPLYQAVDYDSISPDDDTKDLDPTMLELCSKIWVTADAWMLFDAVMRGVSRWYEWREPPVTQNPSTSPLHSHVHFHVSGESNEIRPYVAPIVDTCNRIQSSFLKSVDPLLYKKLLAAGIEPQIYGIRWLRLLFTREFGMHDAMILWDALFACDPTFDLAPWVCVAMLIRIRNQLIPSDYTGQLAILLRYPHTASPSNSNVDQIHHASLLVKQALALQMAPTPFTGTSVMMENRSLLNIANGISMTSLPTTVRRAGQPGTREAFSPISMSRPSGQDRSGTPPGHSRQQSSPQLGLPEMITRGLLERGESLGINKTLLNAVTELRRNIPEMAASLVRTPATSPAPSVLPLTDERTSEERPPWEPRTRLEMEREIASLRDTSKRLGNAVGWIVDVLLQDESVASRPQDLESIHRRKREALECLSYVRDVLLTNPKEIDGSRLVGEEELKSRRSREVSAKPHEVPQMVLHKPSSVPVAEPRSRPTTASALPPLTVTSDAARRQRLSASSGQKSSYLPSASNLNAPPTSFAPWKHTKSDFTGESFSRATLPRPPPPIRHSTQSIIETPLRKSDDHSDGHRSSNTNDPLGVLDSDPS